MYLKRLKTTFNLDIRYIELKKQDAKNELFASRLKSKQQCVRIAFRGGNVQSKMRLRYLKIVKHQEWLNNIKKGTIDNFIGCKTLSKVNLIYLKVKLKEAKFK